MLRLGNTRLSSTESSEPTVTLQKGRVKFNLAALAILGAEIGDFLDVGIDNGAAYVAKMNVAPEGTPQEGKKLSNGSVISSKAIHSQLDAMNADSFTLTTDTMEVFGYTWYKLTPNGAAATNSGTNHNLEADENEVIVDAVLDQVEDY